MPISDPFIAYIDESGNESLSARNGDDYFVISAIVLRRDQMELPTRSVESIRSKFFQTGEMKSSGIGNNHSRRQKLIEDFNASGIKHATIIINKQSINPESGLQYKKSFRKYLPAKIYRMLFSAYEDLHVVSDEHGSREFMISVENYLNQRGVSLFVEQKFRFAESREEIFIQAADIVSGTWRKVFDQTLDPDIRLNLKNIILKNSLLIQLWPPEFDHYSLDISGTDVQNEIIRAFCLRQVVKYLKDHAQPSTINSKEAEKGILRNDVLNFLYDQCIIHENENFVLSKKIITYLKNIGYEKIGNRKLSTVVFSHLRDQGVIVSSGNKGYKIPTSLEDILEYVETTDDKTIPMIRRVNHARDQIMLASKGDIDIFKLAGKEKLDRLAVLLKELDLKLGDLSDAG